MLIIGTHQGYISSAVAPTSAVPISSTVTSRTPSITASTPTAISVPIAAAPALSTISTAAFRALAAATALSLRDLPAAEFACGNEEFQVGVVGGQLPPLRVLVPGTVQLPSAELERFAADGTKSLDYAENRLGRCQLHGGLDLNHFRTNDIA